ncbi:MAG TPA: lipopolysaccharide biosynthesis protein [Candidatus Acidoferrum sp.]|nr:lipopolysaccharide biosynthesis protein [Candidatus Acidoferrum sp.]
MANNVVPGDLNWVEASPRVVSGNGAGETPEERRPFMAPAQDTRGRSVQGSVVSVSSQGLRFVLRTGSMMVLARLLTPEDFGLQAMVVVMTGFLALFRDAGLSAVTVQRDTVSHDQVSTLFWINVVIGVVLAVSMALGAPAIAAFYRDSRLTPICVVSALAFLFHGVSTQHYALLQRQMRFVTLAVIEAVAVAIGVAVGVGMALLAFGYWALVGMALVTPLVTAIGCWISLPWVPGPPGRHRDMRSMLSMGGTLTLNGLVMYLAYNTEKILLGRFWGAESLGVYGRAYQLISLPTDLLTSGVATVAFPMLARLQSDSERMHRAFLRGYSVVVSLTIPPAVICAVFADDIVRIMLGPKWSEVVPVFRLMMPTILAFALINPFAWFLISSGRTRRSLNIACLMAPVSIFGAVLGLQFGPKGVALALSTMMTLLTVPIIAWARAGTTMRGRDIWRALHGPLLAGSVAAIFGFAVSRGLDLIVPTPADLMLGAPLIYGVYFLVLLFPLKQADLYRDLVKQVLRRST